MLRKTVVGGGFRPAVVSVPVDVALVLATDTSGSIGINDIALQFRGYASALTSPAFLNAVTAGPQGRIALTFVTWSSARRQNQEVGWSVIDGAAPARRFAGALLAIPAVTPGYTSISGAIEFSQLLLSRCPHHAMRRVIDVSGNGTNNDGREVTEARDRAVADGIRINGLPIVREGHDLADYYARNVIGGPAAFVSIAMGPGSFESAVLQKLIIEVAGRPDKASGLV